MDLNDRPVAPEPYDLLPTVPSFTVISDEFEDGEPIPTMFAGDGEDLSPSLKWSGFPEETKSFLISCFDPDAPTPAGFWHWTAVNVPSDVTELSVGAGASNEALPEGAFHIRNDGSALSYMGPLPPEGDRPHRYVFAVHALDVEELPLTEEDSPTKAAFTALFHTLSRGTITGTYQR